MGASGVFGVSMLVSLGPKLVVLCPKLGLGGLTFELWGPKIGLRGPKRVLG